MSEPFIGEIRMFGGNFAPLAWKFCDGSLLPIREYEALFNIIGTTYGGDGIATFAIPDLRGRIPLHQNNRHAMGEMTGTESVTLSQAQMPAHTHAALTTADSSATTPINNLTGTWQSDAFVPYLDPANGAPNLVSSAGGGQPHNNMQPYLCVSFIIALEGLYPSAG